MQKLGIKDDSEELKHTQKSKAPSKETEKPKIQDEPAKEANPPLPSNNGTSSDTQPPVVAMPVPKIKHDWYQTEAQVVIEIRIKALKNEDVKVNVESTSLSVSAQL